MVNERIMMISIFIGARTKTKKKEIYSTLYTCKYTVNMIMSADIIKLKMFKMLNVTRNTIILMNRIKVDIA
jgi:hypothetical protein